MSTKAAREVKPKVEKRKVDAVDPKSEADEADVPGKRKRAARVYLLF